MERAHLITAVQAAVFNIFNLCMSGSTLCSADKSNMRLSAEYLAFKNICKNICISCPLSHEGPVDTEPEFAGPAAAEAGTWARLLPAKVVVGGRDISKR